MTTFFKILKFSSDGKIAFLLVLLIHAIGFSQNDTIRLKDKSVLKGDVKRMSKNVLTIETSYSDKDFSVDFNKVEYISVKRKCLVILTKGRRRFGHLSTDSTGVANITQKNGTFESFKIREIVALDEIDDVFWNRFKGSIDLGLNISKANNLQQFSISGSLEYIDNLWLINGNINALSSTQDNATKTKRTDAKLSFLRILKKKWYLLGNTAFLANTEQALEGRISPSIGAGRFLISTNKLYLGLSLGLTYNIENYIDQNLNKTSSELFISSSFNIFDFKDLDLDTSISLLPSLSEKGRFRSDYDLTLKYDLPFDFYLKLGFTLNYDNQPAIVGNDTDYFFSSGFGWKFD